MTNNENFDPKLACKYCKSMRDIEEINGMARDEGLTYGQYVAKYGLFSRRTKTVADREKEERAKADAPKKRRRVAPRNEDGYFVDPGVANVGVRH